MNEPGNDWLEEAVRSEGAVIFSDHPPSRHLVLYSEAPHELADTDLRALTDHLRVCDECADDLARLRSASIELNGLEVAGTGPSLRDRVLRFLAPRFLIPAVSLAIAAIAVFGPDSAPESMLPIGHPVTLRSEVERGGATEVVADASGRITLSFFLPDDDQGPVAMCDVRILDSGGHEVARIDRAGAFDEYGTFVLTLDASGLTPGGHELVAVDRLGERRFFFEYRDSEK